MSRPPNSDEHSSDEHSSAHDNVSDLGAFRAKRQKDVSESHEGLTGLGLPDGKSRTRAPWDEPAKKPLRLLTPPETPTRLRVRAELVDSEPAIWRRLEIPSYLTLDVVHEVLQAAFGWTNSHLHRFTPDDDRYGQESEGILTPFDIEEGDEGIPEDELRLDQLVGKQGDTLYYTYDFGDDWVHRITVEAVEAVGSAAEAAQQADASPETLETDAGLTPGDQAVRCTAGERLGPPEDAGGIYWYERLVEVSADSKHPDFAELYDQLRHYGLYSFKDVIDLAEINRALDRAVNAAQALQWLRTDGSMVVEPDVLQMIAREGAEAQRFLAGFLHSARLVEPVEIDVAAAQKATAVIRAFLGHVGDGIKLTSAGYLPPTNVKAMMAELDPDKEWFGEATREAQTGPLLALREAVTGLGLTRKYRGALLITKRGAQLKDDAPALWRYLAKRLPVERTTYGREFGFLLLMLVAAGEATSSLSVRNSLDLLTAVVGWQLEPGYLGGGRYGNAEAINYVRDTADVLVWVGTGALLGRMNTQSPMAAAGARLLAGAALRTAH